MTESNECLTKANLVESIFNSLPVDKQKAVEIVEEWIELIKSGLALERKVMLSGFGVFLVKDKNARVGRNPQTDDKIIIGARRRVKFKPSELLLSAINESTEGCEKS